MRPQISYKLNNFLRNYYNSIKHKTEYSFKGISKLLYCNQNNVCNVNDRC